MVMGNRPTLCIPRIFALAVLFSLCTLVVAQEKERPKLKNFGSTLKRIKWDEEKNAAAEGRSKSTPQTESEEIGVVKVETSLVSNDVLVVDAKGNFVAGLTSKDFLVTEDGQPQQVGMFSMGDEIKVPRSIVLVIDYSCLQRPFVATSVAAAKALVDKLLPTDSMAIVTDDVELIQDFTRDKKKLKSQLDSLPRIVRIPIKSGWFESVPQQRFGKGLQYSALMATLREAFNNEDPRPIVIFQTNGSQLRMLRNSPLSYRETICLGSSGQTETGLCVSLLEGATPKGVESKQQAKRRRELFEKYRTDFSLDDIYRAAEKARATIYTVVPGRRMVGRPLDEITADIRVERQNYLDRFFPNKFDRKFPLPIANAPKFFEAMMREDQLKTSAEDAVMTQTALASVATSTGGWTMFLETPEQAEDIYSNILSDMNQRYIVGYYPTNKEQDGKRRRINITVRNHPDYTVIGRRWYYARATGQ